MAHFAEIDADNKVIRVLVVSNENEHRGQEFLADECGLGGTWIQTSYNANFGGKFAGVGNIWNGTEFVESPEQIQAHLDYLAQLEAGNSVEEPTE